MKKSILLFLFLCSLYSHSQQKPAETFRKEEITVAPELTGNLYSPVTTGKTDLIILIAGSGPTNRDGNQVGARSNSLKYLAEALAEKGTAVFSYDKRFIAQIIAGTFKEEANSTFDGLITDAGIVTDYFKKQKKYKHIIIAGHSEGSLVGMIAAKGRADAFISLAGAGRTIDNVLEEQLTAQAPYLKEEVRKDLDLLKKGETFELKNPLLGPIFRSSLQPYLISWIRLNPSEEIKKLNIPVLIVNGTKDLQVKVPEAELLKQAKPDAQLKIIEGMNHIFKEVKGDDTENMDTYTNPDLPVIPELVIVVNQFIKGI